MGKLKTFFSKYKGYISTVLLGLLTIIEQYGGYINTLFGGGFVIGGIEIIPVVTFAITIIVGILSNGFSKEQMEKIKALIADENPQKPLSDAQLTKALEAEGLAVARRTVAKYRESLGIPASSLRKKF